MEVNAHARRLSGRQSPFTWMSSVWSERECAAKLDKTCLLGTGWAVVVDKLQVGYSAFQRGDRRRGRAQLAACYIALLPTFHPVCDIVNDHREALRHVLDTSWAFMALADGAAGDELLERFIRGIAPASELPDKQRAALLAIRGKNEDRLDLTFEAIRLDPGEGQWRLEAGWSLEQERGIPGAASPPDAQELTLLRDAFRLRPNPDTICRLARSLLSAGKRGHAEARRLHEEALVRWPNHPRVLFQTALEFPFVHREVTDTQATREQIKQFRRLLDVVGDCAYVHSKLAMLCGNAGLARDEREHRKKAEAIFPEVFYDDQMLWFNWLSKQ